MIKAKIVHGSVQRGHGKQRSLIAGAEVSVAVRRWRQEVTVRSRSIGCDCMRSEGGKEVRFRVSHFRFYMVNLTKGGSLTGWRSDLYMSYVLYRPR